MARKEIVTVSLTDDLTGEEITDNGKFVKVTVEVDGERERFEIDLTKVNYDKMRELLSPYFKAGRVSTGKGTPVTGDSEYNTKVREFAASVTHNGTHTYTYNDDELSNPGPRGRVPQVWKSAYDAYVERSAMIDAADATKAAENGTATETAKPAAKAVKGK